MTNDAPAGALRVKEPPFNKKFERFTTFTPGPPYTVRRVVICPFAGNWDCTHGVEGRPAKLDEARTSQAPKLKKTRLEDRPSYFGGLR
jgi:hypothetical protein